MNMEEEKEEDRHKQKKVPRAAPAWHSQGSRLEEEREAGDK